MQPTRFVPAIVLSLVALTAAAAAPRAQAPAAQTLATWLVGHFDNKAQMGRAELASQPPHVTLDIDNTPQPDWALWHVRLETDAQTAFEQTWAFHRETDVNGGIALVPYYQLHQDTQPAAAAFDPQGWLSLEGCALHLPATGERLAGVSEGEPCVVVAMGVGARRALLPVGIAFDGSEFVADFNLAGVRTHIQMERE